MAVVTVGVPVFNGGALLDECLACLAGQTFSDIRVVVFDNASTDATAEIAQDWARHDRRFEYFRQSENLGSTRNFLDSLAAARSRFFMWRAHDDLSSPNYVEVLHWLLDASKDASLAVGAVHSQRIGTADEKNRPMPDLHSGPRLFRIQRVVAGSHASWYYGLWRRHDLAEIFVPLTQAYPNPWGADHLTLFGPILDDKIVGSEAALFMQRAAADAPLLPSFYNDASLVWDLRRRFIKECQRMAGGRKMPMVERLKLRRIISAHASRRIWPIHRILRVWLLKNRRP